MFSEEVKKVCNHFKDKNKLGLRHHKFYNQIKSETDFLPEEAIIGQRSWHVLNNTKDIPKCLECKIKEVKWQQSKSRYYKFCSCKCCNNNLLIKNEQNKNRRQTFLNKYSVDNPTKSKEISKKVSEALKNKSKEEKEETLRKQKQTNLDRYGVNNPAKSKIISQKISNILKNKSSEEKREINKKRKQTNINKYGVEYVTQLKIISKRIGIKNKINWQNKSGEEKEGIIRKHKQTILNKYGVEYSFQSETVKNKTRQTNLNRYGVEHPMKSKKISKKVSDALKNKSEEEKEEIIRKHKQTNLNKYGVEHVTQLKKFQDKVKQTNLNKYGVEHVSQRHLSKDTLDKLKDPDYLKDQHHNKKKTLTEIAKEFGCSSFPIYQNFHKYNIPILTHPNSFKEKEVISYIKEIYKKDFPINTRKVITPLELDIYLEDLKLAVEFNGTYWHSDKEKPKDYHFNKMKLCYERNIKLINIYEYEWDNYQSWIKYWLKRYINNELDNVIVRDLYLEDIADKKEIILSLNWPINYELLKKNNFKFKETLEPEAVKINNFDIYDAGKIVLERNK